MAYLVALMQLDMGQMYLYSRSCTGVFLSLLLTLFRVF